MTTTDVIIGGAIALLVVQRVRAAYREHRHAARPATVRELAQIAAGAASGTALGAAAVLGEHATRSGWPGWGAGVRGVVSLGVRLAFLGWLYDVTDGAAFSPFGVAQDVVGATAWHPVLVALGVTEVVARVGGVAVRTVAVRTVTGGDRGDGAVPVGPARPV